MSRGSSGGGDDVVRHRGRLLQLAESNSSAKSSWKRRGYSGSRSGSASSGKLLLGNVRNDPSYTPNIEHLVFPDRRNSNPSPVGSPTSGAGPTAVKGAGKGGAGGGGKPTRSRLAEVFALSRYAHHSHPTHSETSAKSSSGGKGSRLLGGSRKSASSSTTAPSAIPALPSSSVSSGKVSHPPPTTSSGRYEGLLLSRRWASEEPVRGAGGGGGDHYLKVRASPEPNTATSSSTRVSPEPAKSSFRSSPDPPPPPPHANKQQQPKPPPPPPTSSSSTNKPRVSPQENRNLLFLHGHAKVSVAAKTPTPPSSSSSSVKLRTSPESNLGLGVLGVGGVSVSGGRGSAGGGKVRASPSPENNWQQQRSVPTTLGGGGGASPGQKDSEDMATTRGPNVSVLHLRSSSENWETTLPLTTYHGGVLGPRHTSGRSGIPTLKFGGSLQGSQSTSRGTNYASLPTRRRDAGPSSNATALFIGGSMDAGGGTCTRELSPVRWCDREVDGVYLGRSGWVQVQQRSLDENRRANYKSAPTPTTKITTTTTVTIPIQASGTLPTSRRGIKLVDYHCSNSEPGKFPDGTKIGEQQRPAFLPLPIDFSRRDFPPSRNTSPSPLPPENIADDIMSPPPITPIISPPPAFQDLNKKYGTSPRLRSSSGKPPFLPRSNAIVDSDVISPPPSPPPPINWSTLPSPRSTAPLDTGISSLTTRLRRLTPSPVTTPLQPLARIPQAKSLEDTTGTRRNMFQKYDSSSSSSSSFGFRSLDSNVTPRGPMPRLSETDSSVGGYEDGDEASPFINNTGGFSAITSPETPSGNLGLQAKDRVSVNGGKVSPSTARLRDGRVHQRTVEQRSYQMRRSPGSDSAGNSKKTVSNDNSSSSSSSSSSCGGGGGGVGRRSPCPTQTFRRSSAHPPTKQQQQQQPPPVQPHPTRLVAPTSTPATHETAAGNVYHTWDSRGNRVRRSRSLQLPETKSPGGVSPAGGPGSHSSREHTPSEYQYFLVKNYNQQQPYYPTVEPHRVVVKMGPDQTADRQRRPFVQHRKVHSEDTGFDPDLRWDAEEEARVVTEYLYGTRSRAAARALLMHRFHNKDSQDSRYGKDSQDLRYVPKESQDVRYHGKEPQDTRYLVKDTQDPTVSSNVFFGSSRGKAKQPHQQQSQPLTTQQRQRVLQRGATTPTMAGPHVFVPSPEVLNTCNPNSCDFWPHCSHRDSVYPPPPTPHPSATSHNKSSTPSPSSSSSKLPSAPATSGSMRLSQSYPTAANQGQRGRSDTRRSYENNEKGKRSEVSRGPSTRSSPASLDRVDEYEMSRKLLHGVMNGGVSDRVFHSPEIEEKKTKWRAGPQYSQHTQIPRRPSGGAIDRLKISHDPSSSSLNHEQDIRREMSGYNVNLGGLQRQGAGVNVSLDLEAAYERPSSALPKERKVSPVMAGAVTTSRSPSAKDGSSSSSTSSSSSDIWVTTSDRTVTKSPRTQKSSGTSTPLDDVSVTRSPVRERDRSLMACVGIGGRMSLDARPGSAPAEREEEKRKKAFFDAQQRSLSLPKSFLSPTFKPPRQSGVFPWKRQTGGGSPRPTAPPSPGLCPSPGPPQGSHTAPVTPVKEVRGGDGGGGGGGQYRRPPGLSKSVRHNNTSSVPLDEPATSRSDWDIRRTWSNGNSGNERIGPSSFMSSEATLPLLTHPRLNDNAKDISQSQRNISDNVSESVLQKFRKSLALKFHKKGSSGSSGSKETVGEEAMEEPSTEESQRQLPESPPPPARDDTATDPKFKFGSLVWRSSKERKKGKKAARNAKCNSGDSGIQLEIVAGHVAGGDSSESHDTDHLADDEPLDEMDSPPAVRRRVNTGSEKSSSRPQSEVINQILIDKFKADLHTRAQTRHHNVRRTHSDLGGQRIFNWDMRNSYRRMFSSPSPIKMRPPRTSPPRPANTDTVTLRSSKRRNARPPLRRSISQPLGINELSPLMRRKPCAMPVAPRASSSNVPSEDEHDGRGGTGTSDDDMMSDSESSIASLTDRKKSFEQAMEEDLVILAEAVWDHVAMEQDELAFRAGDVVEVLDTVDKDWWWGGRGDKTGWFPAAFVRLRVSQEDTVEDCLAAMASGSTSASQLRRRTSISLLSNDQVRSSVVRELVNTERDFVKILRDVAEGYLVECKRRLDMFSPEQIDAIFCNLEELLHFQTMFLEDLENRVDWEAPHRSCVGDCFLTHRAGFRIYSEYCNSHPMATATLQELYQHNSYSKFFEACRLMRGLMEIPLDGYLLTPVQRICKYPLQLAELLKYTKADHPDYAKIQEALDAMRDVAVLINERKRRMESLEKLAAWQQRVEAWEGEDLIEISSQLIHQGEAVRVTTGMWTNNITLFLFDHQLVYCKKDILKRNTYVYKGRIDLDTSEVVDVQDGKDPQLGVTVRHGLKVFSRVRDKWLLFCCRCAVDKQRWLDALGEERRLVAQDQRDGLQFPPAARQLARMAARCQRRPPSKPRGKNYKRDSGYSVSRTELAGPSLGPPPPVGSTHSLGRKVGTWFTFGSSKKGRALSRATLSHHRPT